MTALAGLPTYVELAVVCGLRESIQRHLRVCAGRTQGWTSKRLKAVRFGFIQLAGRVVIRAWQLVVRLSGNHPAYDLLLKVRRRLRALWMGHCTLARAPTP